MKKVISVILTTAIASFSFSVLADDPTPSCVSQMPGKDFCSCYNDYAQRACNEVIKIPSLCNNKQQLDQDAQSAYAGLSPKSPKAFCDIERIYEPAWAQSNCLADTTEMVEGKHNWCL